MEIIIIFKIMNIDIKCNSKNHEKRASIVYCQECRLYLCDKCMNNHKELYDHHLLDLSGDENTDIFTGICKEKNHTCSLDYFCKDHNQLCCALCIVKHPKNGTGQHTNCNTCIIEDIYEEKKNKLNDNIKLLEDISKDIELSINELKQILDGIDEKKEEIKSKVQKIFTKIRNNLNEREDEILMEIDNNLDKIISKEKFLKKYKNFPKKIKNCLDKSKLINNEWTKNNDNNNNNLNSFINDCINLDNNIKEIDIITEKIKTLNSNNEKIEFHIMESELNNILKAIKSFGGIYHYPDFNFMDKNIKGKFNINKDKNNIINKVIDEEWSIIQSEKYLEQNKNYIFKIKILKSKNNYIFIGLSPKIDISILDKEFDLQFLTVNSSLEQYTMQNPFIADGRDHVLGEEFIASVGKTYEIYFTGKRLKGNIGLAGGIFYTKQNSGEPFDGYSEKFVEIEDLKNGYKKYYKKVKVPSGKMKGKIYFQIEQGWTGGSTSWAIFDISIYEKERKEIRKNENKINCGYFMYLHNSSLFSGYPHCYFNKKMNLKKIKEEITIIIDMKERRLIFQNQGDEILYKDIILDKQLFPTLLLYNSNDSVELI